MSARIEAMSYGFHISLAPVHAYAYTWVFVNFISIGHTMTTNLIDGEARQRLDTFVSQTHDEHSRFIGFPAALDFDYHELQSVNHLFLNNER